MQSVVARRRSAARIAVSCEPGGSKSRASPPAACGFGVLQSGAEAIAVQRWREFQARSPPPEERLLQETLLAPHDHARLHVVPLKPALPRLQHELHALAVRGQRRLVARLGAGAGCGHATSSAQTPARSRTETSFMRAERGRGGRKFKRPKRAPPAVPSFEGFRSPARAVSPLAPSEPSCGKNFLGPHRS